MNFRLDTIFLNHSHPDDLVADPRLSAAEKRAALASWMSDARAIENAPALRRLDNGAIVALDALRRAWITLDGPPPAPVDSPRKPPRFPRRRRPLSRGLSRFAPSRRRDDDDDPPPAPAALAIAPRASFAHAAPPDRHPVWAAG